VLRALAVLDSPHVIFLAGLLGLQPCFPIRQHAVELRVGRFVLWLLRSLPGIQRFEIVDDGVLGSLRRRHATLNPPLRRLPQPLVDLLDGLCCGVEILVALSVFE
jgi:hypothetical protein